MLASDLYREVRPEFFRVLADGRTAAVYVDILDALEIEASQRQEGLPREEATAIASDILVTHPTFEPDSENPITGDPGFAPAEKARRVLENLLRAGWLEEPTRSDWQRVIYFNPNGGTLLTALRKIARPDATVFSDKLIGVCAALAHTAALAEQPWELIQACRENVQLGLGELRAMQKSVDRLVRRQIEARTLGENLSVVFDEYAEQVGRTCYAELIRARLPARLGEAGERLRQMLEDADLLQRMQAEVLRRDAMIEHAAAMARVRNALDDLARALEGVLPLADEIDRRTAEFARRSLARFRYLQEVVGERRGQVKEFFETINNQLRGRRLGDVDTCFALPKMDLAAPRLLAGRESLYDPPTPRSIEENAPVEDDPSEADCERARRQIENALRDALTVGRANRFVAQLNGGKGARIASTDLPVHTEDDLADIMSALLHAESREAHFRVEAPRFGEDEDGAPERDSKAGCRIERFDLVKK